MNGTQQTPYNFPSTIVTIDSVPHFAGVTKEFLKYFKSLPVRREDAFIVSYPKSGTTWVSEIIRQIHCEGKVDKKNIDDRIPFLEFLQFQGKLKTKEDLYDFFLNHPLPRVFKTHLRQHEVPMGDDDDNKPRYIYVMRNPKDVAVSFYHHYKGLQTYEYDQTWDEFFEIFMDNKVHYGSWFDHVLGWWPHRDDANVLLLKYEDMQKDLPRAVQQIARFFGKEISAEMIQRVSHQTTFKAMSVDQERFLNKSSKSPDTTFNFVRKGKVGDWRNYFTEKQNRRFDEMYEKKMAGSGLELEFEL